MHALKRHQTGVIDLLTKACECIMDRCQLHGWQRDIVFDDRPGEDCVACCTALIPLLPWNVEKVKPLFYSSLVPIHELDKKLMGPAIVSEAEVMARFCLEDAHKARAATRFCFMDAQEMEKAIPESARQKAETIVDLARKDPVRASSVLETIAEELDEEVRLYLYENVLDNYGWEGRTFAVTVGLVENSDGISVRCAVGISGEEKNPVKVFDMDLSDMAADDPAGFAAEYLVQRSLAFDELRSWKKPSVTESPDLLREMRP